MDSIKCLTLSVRGLRCNEKRKTIYRYLEQNKVNIAFLQETFCTLEYVKQFNAGWKGTIFHSFSNSNHSKGVCILISENVTCKVINVHRDNEGRKVLVNVKIHDEYYSLVSVYCPNTEKMRVEFIKKLQKWTIEKCLNTENIILGGDLNCTLSDKDRLNKCKSDKSTKHLKKFMKVKGLSDVWREQNTDVNEFTYIDPSNRGYDSRIDYVLVSLNLVSAITLCKIIQSPAPDHKAIVMNVQLCDSKRGPGYWKLNTDILKEEAYITGIKEIVSQTSEDYKDISKKLLWELCKIRIKEFSITYSINRRKLHKSKIKELEEKLDLLDKNEDTTSRKERKILKKELDIMYMSDARGAQIRSKARFVEDREKNTAYFTGLEKSRQQNNVIKNIKYNNTTHSNNEDILKAAADFYEKLYSSKYIKQTDISSYLDNVNIVSKLTEVEKTSIEGKIKICECEKVIHSLKQNKSPGLDGIPSEFYQQCWSIVQHHAVESYNE